ncbi:hypothetical protein OR221_2203 [Microbacterium laevaniformans OR221]|nr:hypothetical protein OR221_2203 [Microbacterium laevaniformans OR221]
MRIVVSGTHASGKSTLIADFARRHPEYAVFADPFELIDESDDRPAAAMFASQLRLAAGRLIDIHSGENLIAERGPLDFLAYLLALDELGRTALDRSTLSSAADRTRGALATVDHLVLLPLTAAHPIHVGDDEDAALRETMNDVLLDLLDDADVVPAGLTVTEVTGSPAERLATIETLIAEPRSSEQV